ncbi:MAG: aconitase family protein, partial [Nitratireductor sp.]
MTAPQIPLASYEGPNGAAAQCVALDALAGKRTRRLPASLRIVLENVARQALAGADVAAALDAIAAWTPDAAELTVPLRVSRVILPDSSGLPVLMDLAAARDAVAEAGSDPAAIEPLVPVTLVVDHSLIVDVAGRPDAEARNIEKEYQRNRERYAFFKWAQQAFQRLRVVPPGAGIIHQVHLEKLARVVEEQDVPGVGRITGPEFVLGCDSHTPMVNG